MSPGAHRGGEAVWKVLGTHPCPRRAPSSHSVRSTSITALTSQHCCDSHRDAWEMQTEPNLTNVTVPETGGDEVSNEPSHGQAPSSTLCHRALLIAVTLGRYTDESCSLKTLTFRFCQAPKSRIGLENSPDAQ